MANETILVMDAGGFKSQRMARALRDAGVYSEILPLCAPADKICALRPLGFVLVGEEGITGEAEQQARTLVAFGLPILAVGGGMHLLCRALGGSVSDTQRVTGDMPLNVTAACPLFEGLADGDCRMDYTQTVTALPRGMSAAARAGDCAVAAAQDGGKLFAVQFLPDQEGSALGVRVLENFARGVCGARERWSMAAFAQQSIETIRAQVGGGRVLLALSGGVDSSVCAALISKAIGDRLTCIFVDHGLMRKNEPQEVRETFTGGFDMNLVMVDAEQRFLGKLDGVSDPERKRRIVGEEFIRVFEEEASKLGAVDFLAQGTIYPDIVESGAGGKGVVKSHHNVGGLPDDIGFKGMVEPLKYLFKDEVRALGRELGLPRAMVMRQPFPGPGLSVRCIGAPTKQRLDTLREADAIMRAELDGAQLSGRIDQYFAVLTDFKTVGVRDGQRTYGDTLAFRAVRTTDFMEAEVADIPLQLLERIARRVIDEVPGIGRVVYDITAKPPGTIEWE